MVRPDSKESAKALRKELKEKFPRDKFSVRISQWSLGSAITVRWIDGAATNKVNQIVQKYDETYRDNMTGEILWGTRSAGAERQYSVQVRKKAEDFIKPKFPNNTNQWDDTLQTTIWAYLQGSDFYDQEKVGQ